MLANLAESADYLRKQITTTPELAIILGTGLNSIADLPEDKTIIPYKNIPHMPVSTAPSHQGKMVFGNLNGKKILILQGRIHYYEGYAMQEVTYPIRILQSLKIKNLVVTNASGSLRENMKPGDLVLLNDHINFMGTNPLIGRDHEDFGERFPSMNTPYDREFIQIFQTIADNKKIRIQKGIYAAVTGPSLETKAECMMLQKLGADMVGMSTVPEVIVARQAGMKILGLSVITNYSNIFHSRAHSQEEIRKNADRAKHNIEFLLREFIKKL